MDITVCCGSCEDSQFGDRPKDENDGEVNCLQNVNICVTLSVGIYAGGDGFCTDRNCFTYCFIKGIKTGGSAVAVIPLNTGSERITGPGAPVYLQCPLESLP